jgi:hypothetical protein
MYSICDIARHRKPHNDLCSILGFRSSEYFDRTPERRKFAVREAPQKYPLLENGSLEMFPQQQMSTQ